MGEVVLFLLGANFWNMLGASPMGSMINLPVTLVMISGLKEALDILESEIAFVQTASLHGVPNKSLSCICFHMESSEQS